MKRLWPLALALLLVLLPAAGCASQRELAFSAVIQQVDPQGITVITGEPVGFQRAWLELSGLALAFEPQVGQTVDIRAQSAVLETDPVRLTGVQMTLKEAETAMGYTTITPREAMEKMVEGVAILDVRAQSEYDTGHIEGALLLPHTEVAQRAAELLPDKDQIILVYCQSGRRSAAAAAALAALGYTQVYNFGGITAWPGPVVK